VEPTELFALLADKPIGRVCFTHLSRQHRENLEALKTQAAEALGKMKVTFLEDGDLVEISD
jgi:chorismate-pyruvate lyase